MATVTLGEVLRAQRESRGVSLRKFARTLGISPAFLVDLEKDRRRPSPELLQMIADNLDVPAETFGGFSADLPAAVKDWADGQPVLGKALKLMTQLADPTEALYALERKPSPRSRPFVMAIYESELQAIGLESSSWDSETGGDLFGVWEEIPIVYLATRSGPNSIRDHAHFRLDVDYLIKLSFDLQRDWGLRYFGDWHSHHKLGLHTPSRGDRGRITRLATKNSFHEMAEFIVTFSSSSVSDRSIQVQPYAYLEIPDDGIAHVTFVVLTGTSPIRDGLTRTGAFPEQRLASYSSFPLDRLQLPREPLPRPPGNSGPAVHRVTDRLLQRAVTNLQTHATDRVETHITAFGYVIVVPIAEEMCVAFAINGSWPHEVVQVNWMDRKVGSTRELPLTTNAASLTNPARLVEMLDTAKASRDRPA